MSCKNVKKRSINKGQECNALHLAVFTVSAAAVWFCLIVDGSVRVFPGVQNVLVWKKFSDGYRTGSEPFRTNIRLQFFVFTKQI